MDAATALRHSVGFGLFALMVIAMFQARLTANFATAKLEGRVDSINHAIMRREKVCVMQALSNTLIAKYPLLSANLTVPMKNVKQSLAAMDGGLCAHAAVDINMMQAIQLKTGLNTGVEAHANKTIVGTMVMQIPNGMPVREDLQFPLSYAIVNNLESGAYERHKRDAQCEFIANATPGCDFAVATQPASADREDSISVDTMWGPIMVAFFATTAGVAYSLLDRAVHFDASEMLANNAAAIPLKNSLMTAREAVKRRSLAAKKSIKALKSSNSARSTASSKNQALDTIDDVAVGVEGDEETAPSSLPHSNKGPVPEEQKDGDDGDGAAGRSQETTV